jgi:hypothetical protein
MRTFKPEQLLWVLSFFPLILAFPGTESSHNGAQAHRALHKRCPYASVESDAAPKHEKRFLVNSMMSPIDGMQKKNPIKWCVVLKRDL